MNIIFLKIMFYKIRILFWINLNFCYYRNEVDNFNHFITLNLSLYGSKWDLNSIVASNPIAVQRLKAITNIFVITI